MPIIAITIGLAVLGLLVVFIAVNRQGKGSVAPNYRTLFILGMIWLPAGFATENPAFWVMGLFFLIIGLANRDKWEEERKWSELSPAERQIRFVLLVGLTLLLVVGVGFFFLAKSGGL